MVICIAWTIPYLILVTYRNLIGPLDKTFALLMNFCKIFGTLCCLLTFFEITLIWYVFKMVLKAIPKMDDAEWAKVLILLNILVMASISYIMDMKGCYFSKSSKCTTNFFSYYIISWDHLRSMIIQGSINKECCINHKVYII